ncbi:MAG TPA: carboxylesterase/lipase family protein [Rhizomicrobium sp.]|jgi:para-nitrobenzyl esterase|nr:carboxylesterase/lipase family protein [Rhizomicrobium sp.]
MTDFSRRSVLAASTSMAALVAFDAPAFAQMPPPPIPVINTSAGPVQGISVKNTLAFKGIRYGAPPTGALRFLPPQKPAKWTAPYAAGSFGAPAIQMPSGAAGEEPKTPLAKSLQVVYPTLAEVKTGNEDCLFLNLWTPFATLDDRKKQRPVMVWLHGGGFAYGSGAWPSYDGANLAMRGDVVVVTLNHRLNAFGYMELGDIFGPAYAESGNAGMLDIVLALEWVRDNIGAFGGDPSNVTIFGESGGGAKVSTLMAMPSAKGLFHKAIVESGPGLKGVPEAAATADAKAILAALKITDLKALQAAPAADIVKAAFAVAATRGPGAEIRFLAPVVDGVVLPTDPFDPVAPAQSADVPLIIGTNKDEMTLFVAGQPWFGRLTEAQLDAQAPMMAGPNAPQILAALKKAHPDYSPSYLLAELMTTTFMWGGSITLATRKAEQGGAPVYMYQLVWETPIAGGLFKSPHTLEIPFVFDTVEATRPLLGPGPAPQQLADQMSAAWVAFAKTGNPNNKAIPHWPAYDAKTRATMLFDVSSKVVDDPYADVREALKA